MTEVVPYAVKKRRERQRKYRQRPEVKERCKAYMAEYNRRPEVKERHREQSRTYMREYTKRPEVKERKAKIALQKRIDKAVAFLKEHGYSVIKEEPHEQQS